MKLSNKSNLGKLLTNVHNVLNNFILNGDLFFLQITTLSLKRNAPWIPWLPQWPRVKVKWPWPGHIWSQEFETGRKKPRSKMSNGSLDILKSPRVCLVLEFVKLLKSHCDQWKFGISSKQCISFGQEWVELKSWVFFFNSSVFQVMF